MNLIFLLILNRYESNSHVAHNKAICEYYMDNNPRQSLKKLLHKLHSIDKSITQKQKHRNESLIEKSDRHYLLFNKAECHLNKHQYSAAIEIFKQLIFDPNLTSISNTITNRKNENEKKSANLIDWNVDLDLSKMNMNSLNLSIFIRSCLRLFLIYTHHEMIDESKYLFYNVLIKNTKIIENLLTTKNGNNSTNTNGSVSKNRNKNINKSGKKQTKNKKMRSLTNGSSGGGNDSNENSDESSFDSHCHDHNHDTSNDSLNANIYDYNKFGISLAKYQYWLQIMECQILLMDCKFSQCFDKLKNAIRLIKSNPNLNGNGNTNSNVNTNNNNGNGNGNGNKSLHNSDKSQSQNRLTRSRSSTVNFDRLDRVRVLFIRAHLEMLQGKTKTAKSQLLATHSNEKSPQLSI